MGTIKCPSVRVQGVGVHLVTSQAPWTMGVKVSRVVSRIRAFDQSGGVLGRLWADEHALALALHRISTTTTIANTTVYRSRVG